MKSRSKHSGKIAALTALLSFKLYVVKLDFPRLTQCFCRYLVIHCSVHPFKGALPIISRRSTTIIREEVVKHNNFKNNKKILRFRIYRSHCREIQCTMIDVEIF